jgi:SAM-dependent methyltransferase
MIIDITQRLFVDAGIGAGQRVLDLGCGYGRVSALVADLVGPTGSVVGVDRDEPTLEMARSREGHRPTVTFVHADLDALDVEGEFDAVVARRVLMYLPRPAVTLATAAARLRPGGVIVVQEHGPALHSPVKMPERDRLTALMWEMVRREGADLQIGFQLAPLLAGAGLAVEHVRADGIVTGPDGPWQGHYPLAMIVRAVAPRLISTGVATEAELGLEGLEARLDAELAAAGVPHVGEVAFGAWGRKGAGLPS